MSDIQTTVKLIKKVNNLLLKRFRPTGSDTLRMKKDEEIVTQADMDANKLMTKFLLKHFSNDDIISEEAPRINNPGKKTWYIDPLDGTTNFAYGYRAFATCIARINEKTEVELGVIGLPAYKEMFWAKKGGLAYLNGKRISVSKNNNHRTKELFLFCGGHSDAGQKKFVKILQSLDAHTTRFRSLASAGIEFSSVACGRADGCALVEVQPWDVLAGVLIVRAAGGKVTNFEGKEWGLNDKTVIASNGISHEKLLKLVE
ncbi:MAG: inositol monophosphatase [Parcubacteria group bacterium]|nr:inositol monophosphatase [Parcubacteria group bacterium]